MKKSFTLVLALFVSLSAFFVKSPVYAEGTPLFSVSSHKVSAGDIVNVEINIKNSPGIASAILSVDFDSELTLESVTYNSAIGGITQEPSALSSPVKLSWMSLNPVSGDALFATLSFKVPDGAGFGKRAISISYNPDDVCNIDENNVNFEVQSGNVEIPCPHNNIEIRNAKEPTLSEAGSTGETYCLDCGEKIADGEIVYARGDANIDCAVNIKDYVRIARFLRDNTLDISEYADVDGNKIIRLDDIVGVRRIILGDFT